MKKLLRMPLPPELMVERIDKLHEDCERHLMNVVHYSADQGAKRRVHRFSFVRGLRLLLRWHRDGLVMATISAKGGPKYWQLWQRRFPHQSFRQNPIR